MDNVKEMDRSGKEIEVNGKEKLKMTWKGQVQRNWKRMKRACKVRVS